MYNRTVRTQLGTCMVIINHKDNKKKCEFFVVPGNGQALLSMPDTAALNKINVNIDSIETASIGGIVSGSSGFCCLFTMLHQV